MQNSDGDPVLHRLARCFGHGLAFGAGFILTERVLRPRAARREPAFEPAAATPATRAGVDVRVVQAIVSAVEQYIEEHAARTERKLDQLKADANLDVAGLRAQVAKMQREFAEAVALIVAQQVAREGAKQAAAIAPLEAELRELRQRLAETENTMRDFADAIGDIVRMAAAHGVLPAERRESTPGPVAEVPRRAAAG
jgi:hypothetical protein